MVPAARESQAGGLLDEAQAKSQWLAAYTRPRHEEKVKQYCEDRGIETFLASCQSWRQWSDRKKLITVPLFPSYLFINLERNQRARAAQAPGFLWFVHNQLGPIAVDTHELTALRRLLVSGLRFDPLPQVRLGDEVEIKHGALRGCRGRLIRKESAKIVLYVSAIGAGVRVSLPDPSWVVPLNGRNRPQPEIG